MTRLLLIALAAGIVLSAAACGSSASATAAAAPASAAAQAAKPSPSASCTLKTTFSYIERDDDPGASVIASEIGNVDFENCTQSLSDFAAEAGQAAGECTTIALASSNPGYNVNEVPAPPLKDVIEAVGPGC